MRRARDGARGWRGISRTAVGRVRGQDWSSRPLAQRRNHAQNGRNGTMRPIIQLATCGRQSVMRSINSVRITLIVLVGALLMSSPIAALAEQSVAAWEAEGIALEKETGIPRLQLPENIPSQESPSKELVHCTVWSAGRTDYVSIWLRKS